MPSVEEGLKAQLRNIESTYGKSIEELTSAIGASGLTKHPEVVAMLKQRYGMTHGAAHRVSLLARDRLGHGTTSGPKTVTESSSAIYDALLDVARAFGDDVEVAPKKGYVSLRRRKQFAMLQPGAKWVNVGLILDARKPTARLEDAKGWNALFTHRVRVASVADIDSQLKAWFRDAYRLAA